MTTLQTADGRLLRSQRPNLQSGGMFAPLWSNGERLGDDEAVLASYTQIYSSQPAVSGVVDKLSRRIASLPFDGYTVEDNRREVVTGDTLDSLIRRPIPRWSTSHLVHFLAQSLLVNGNALLAKVRGNERDSPPEMLWPLDWSYVSAYAPQGGRIEWWSTTQFDGQERFIAVADTVHFAWESPSNEIGISPLQKLGATIRLENAAQRYQLSAFKNGVRPGGIVTLPPGQNPTKEQMDLTRATLQAMHGGVDKAFGIGLVAPGADWKPMNQSAVEAELIEQRHLNWEEVGMVYDMGGPLMNDFRRATYSNVTELQKALYRDIVPPWTTLIEQTFQAQLLDVEPAWMNKTLRFDFSDKLKGEPSELAATLKLEVEAGLITRNEARRILGMAPIGDPNDPNNPHNLLSANTNNQGLVRDLGTNPAGQQ